MEIDQNIAYNSLIQTIEQSSELDDWNKAILKIEIDVNYLGLSCRYYFTGGKSESYRLKKVDNLGECIRWLHTFTTQMGQTKWNLAIFTLEKNLKFNMEFIWDEEKQQSVDEINKNKNKFG